MATSLLESQPLLRVAVAGNPNSGKTTIFNRLTGLRQKVANYPGVTVERKTGRCLIDGEPIELLDLPGAYSLAAQSPDEEIARDVLFGWQPAEPPVDLVLVVVDATNLERNLYLASQVVELGYRTIVVLNMVDMVAGRGERIDLDRLARGLGAPVVETVARQGIGIEKLKATILSEGHRPDLPTQREPLATPALAAAIDALAPALVEQGVAERVSRPVALRLIGSPTGLELARQRFGAALAGRLEAVREALAAEGGRWDADEATARYASLRELVDEALTGRSAARVLTPTDKIDRLLTHRVAGPVLFLVSMAVVFQSIYAWAAPFMDGIDGAFAGLAESIRTALSPGVLTDLLADGVIAGVGGVVIFLPQIVLLFFFLGLLEETGYMARAAFIADRLMSRVGLHGRSFVPLLSSFACAIPGIMAARTIGSRRDRLTTIVVAPLITCSARLPVYTLMIAAFVPDRPLFGPFRTQGATLLSLYLLGVLMALGVATVLKRTILRGPTPALLLELPPYRLPDWRNLGRAVWERASLFLRFAGTIILALSVVLWFLAYFPRADVSDAPLIAVRQITAAGGDHSDAELLDAEVSRVEGRLQLEGSLMGRLGRLLEPLFAPIGFEWRLGVGVVSAFAAREVMVSTLGIIFAVGDDADEANQTLIERLRGARRADGSPLFTPAVVASLLVFFVLACQCMATVGIVVRETGGWKWAMFMVGYMTTLAYLGALIAFQVARAMGG